jgi:hypothetical protein
MSRVMMQWFRSVSLFLLVLVAVATIATSFAGSQEPAAGTVERRVPPEAQNIEKIIQEAVVESKQLTQPVVPDMPRLEKLDQTTRDKYGEALRAYYDYRISGYRHRQALFAWQLWASRLIFWLVVILVSCGVFFSGVQFFRTPVRPRSRRGRVSRKTKETKTEGEDDVAFDESEVIELGASMEGVKVKSPVLGVVILTISFAFFYLYLLYVYPIVDTF